MAETQREFVPRVDSGELDTALAFLSFARHCVLKKADGLSDEQLRRVLVDSGTSILGLVQHLAEVERYWFGYHLTGAAWDAGQEYGMAVPAVNMCYPPLSWQTYDVDFKAAKFDGDKKTEDAVITLKHNGVTVHDHLKLNKGPTGGGENESAEPGSIRLQFHGNPVSFRNIWVVENK